MLLIKKPTFKGNSQILQYFQRICGITCIYTDIFISDLSLMQGNRIRIRIKCQIRQKLLFNAKNLLIYFVIQKFYFPIFEFHL